MILYVYKRLIGRSHINQNVNIPLSNDPLKLSLDHIHYSSVKKTKYNNRCSFNNHFKGLSAD